MAYENPLLMNRAQFPLKIRRLETYRGESKDWDIIYPPVHPSIIETSISLERALSVTDETVEDSIKDLSEMAETVTSMKDFLESLKDAKDGKFTIYLRENVKVYDERIQIDDFLLDNISRQINIAHNGIFFGGRSVSASTFSPTRDDRVSFIYYVDKKNKLHLPSFLPEELVSEYELDKDRMSEDGGIYCSHNYWHTHNLDSIPRKVFCKNFAIAYNNSVVKDKYSFDK